MAIDRLQEKIRKMKNPSVVNFSFLPEHIPAKFSPEENFLKAREEYALELLESLKELVPAVRFSFSVFALAGEEGLTSLERLLCAATDYGYYVFLDGVSPLSAQEAQQTAQVLMSEDCRWKFDGLILSSYIGSDGMVPYVSQLKQSGKDLFVVVRTANKTAIELQDLLTGTRLMHLANADIVNRFAPQVIGRCAYSQVAALAAASGAESLRSLREKYKDIFLLVDGCDYPNGSVKNCAKAFDQLGHGAAVCAGLSVIAAWQEGEGDYLEMAVEAAQRLKKNLLRYVTIL